MFCSKCGREAIEDAAHCVGCGASFGAALPSTKKKTQLSLAAGIIDIAAGSLSLVTFVFAAAFLWFVAERGEGMPLYMLLIPLALLIPSVLAIVGGIFALRRRSWAIALIGSIALILTSTSSLAGIAALVLTVMARDEFE